ncbi:MAG: IS4 family transposase, partial [Proteobacteria bacterium]|nr:IS4 family transposase [Pseudomonadota bacterium]
RWDIEVFFKMMKHYLNLERETQLRDYDGMVAHITIAMSRYIFLSFGQRNHDDPRTLGSLFFACSDEMEDLSLVEALRRILSLAMEKIRSTAIVAEDIALSLVDSIMSIAIDMVQTGQRLLRNSSAVTRY